MYSIPLQPCCTCPGMLELSLARSAGGWGFSGLRPVKVALNKPAGRTSCMLSRSLRPQSSYPSEGPTVAVPAVLAPMVRTILITTTARDYRTTPDRRGLSGAGPTCGPVRMVSEVGTDQIADMAQRQSSAMLTHLLREGSTNRHTSHPGPIVSPLHAHTHPGDSLSCASVPAVGAAWGR